MPKKLKQPTFDEVLNSLRGYGFDVTPAASVANPSHGNGTRVQKHGCAAILTPGKDGPAAFLVKPGIVIGDEIGLILDKGNQKFVKTATHQRPATADHLRSLHKFSEEVRQLTGGISLYNESMGTVSDEYMYDRVKGRNLPESERPKPAWELPVKA